MTKSDTIYALSSGAGVAGIAVIRLTGPAAGMALDMMAGSRPTARQASLRAIRDSHTGAILDRGVVLWFPGPNTVTGEDVAEFHVHGSSAVAAAVFSSLNRLEGVRPAEAGEFTRRAFHNGRMDLVEVEGLADLLKAKTEAQRRLALHHLMGEASSVYEDWRGELIKVLAHVEAAVDFADEEGVAEAAVADVAVKVAQLHGSMAAALAQAEQAVAVRDGVRVVLAGHPNTGKSSLLNAIARREAAIVSSIPGTTRDVIEVNIDLGGIPVILSDTAGLRDNSTDEIELIGIGRTKKELRGADLVIWIYAPDVDGSHTFPADIKPDLIARNKSDLEIGHRDDNDGNRFSISTRTGAGMAELIDGVAELVKQKYGHAENAVIVRARQKQAILESIRYLNDSLRHGTEHLELVAEDLRKAATALARVTGRIDVEDLLSAIFSEFCIGK